MLFRLIILFILSFCALISPAQKRNQVWAFGIGSGLDFNTQPVSLFKSALDEPKAPYFISSICDVQGRLLFYTDGIKVWNTYNQLLPKYKGWWPFTNKVMPLICPYPDTDSLYYLFGIDNGKHKGELMYLTIRMQHPDEFNELVYPTPVDPNTYFTSLTSNASMVLAGTHHCNDKDEWIVTYSQGALQSFLVTKSGVSPGPVSSPAPGLPVELHTGNSNIKFSANGERLVIPLLEESKVVLYDFDKKTGVCSNPMVLSTPSGQILEDVELSPDGNKLYMGCYEVIDVENDIQLHYIFQLDLDKATPSDIAASAIILNEGGDRAACSPRGSCIYVNRTMQLGPDGKIYVGMKEYTTTNLDRSFSVIEDPNKAGAAARYRRNYVNIGQQYKFINYNYIRSGSFSLRENGIKVQQRTCADQPARFSLLFHKVDSVHWNFGDPASGNRNGSIALAPEHSYPGPGTYSVSAVLFSGCLTDTAKTTITIQTDESVKVPDWIKDTVICKGGQLRLNATTRWGNTYQWENGLIYPERTIDSVGLYSITIMNDCSLDRKSFRVVEEACQCQVFVPNAFTPNNDGRNDVFRPSLQCQAKDYHFRIYDRYGGVVFESKEPGKGWNGKKQSHFMNNGLYLWLLEYKNPNSGAVVQQSGSFLLIR
ncbi:MAG TPA: gliding motility-associated C-terminal domain-containing protein [Flavisolibacter sp.]|nr:gliding motility-associated C-terminal domain-containing protein [Flavisolibacter sp.]